MRSRLCVVFPQIRSQLIFVRVPVAIVRSVSDNHKSIFSRVSLSTRSMTSKEAPYCPQDVEEIATLVKGLESSAKKGPGSKKSGVHGKKTTFDIPGSKNGTVDSWRFQDWDYKRRDLPTYARGLFTYRKRNGQPEIAIRGYDKFFNQEEVNETKWVNVEKDSRGPFELSVKENGCIIFIGGLEDDVLLVCSKHSTGARADVDLSHAKAGEQWIDRQLAVIGKTRADLASELRKRNATAVAELCDDSFEEHVLAYDEKAAGLYLHGINLNLPEFATYPCELVHAFADQWGFKKAEYFIKDDIKAVKKFLEDCAETGSWNGRDTEGFVIRCQRKLHGQKDSYVDWFFKYKFEEPYLMYRQWREATKSVISGKAPRFRKHKQITEEYLLYARRQLAMNHSLAKQYQKNHGIIAMRDGFLRERGTTGADIIRNSELNAGHSDTVSRNVVLVPVASIGCGKTTIALALVHLFGWGHVQNDNITGKSNRPKQFATQVCNSLALNPAMIADRNNHQRRERKQILDDVSQVIPTAKFIALHYVHDPKEEMLPKIRKITQDRIFERGDNHQTIQAGTKSSGEIISIMEGFLQRFEPVDPNSSPDDGFDEIIDLDVASNSRDNLETVVKTLHTNYPKLVPEMPDSLSLDVAIRAALEDYAPDIKHDLSFKSKKAKANGVPSQNQLSNAKAPKLEFFAVQLQPSMVNPTLSAAFASVSPETAKFYRQLSSSRRIQPNFHVTLIHRTSSQSHPGLWSRLLESYIRKSNEAGAGPDMKLGECKVQLERIVWDNRVMCIVVRLLSDEGWETANDTAHITVGTASADIKPKESNDLLKKWMELGADATTGIQEMEVDGHVTLYGTVKAVLQGHSGR